MSRKKIIYTGNFRLPNGDAGAARVLNNAKLLRSLGHEVIFFSWGGSYQDTDIHKDGYYHKGFKYIITNDIDRGGNHLRKINNYFTSGDNALSSLSEIVGNIDIVIGYDTTLFFTTKIVKFCRRNDIKYVADLTEWSDSNEFPGGKLFLFYWLNNFNMYLMKNLVKNKIVISKFLNNYYYLSNNIVLPPLVDLSERKWSSTTQALLPFDGIRVVYAGSPGKKDLLEVILKSFINCLKSFLKLQIVIVGVKQEDLENYKIKDEVKSYPENIVFCGRVPQESIPQYYRASHFSVIIRERTRKTRAGFPTKLVESLSSGCPVILNETSDISDFITDRRNGFLVENSSSEALEKVLFLITQIKESDLLIMRDNSLRTSKEYFNFQSYRSQMGDFLSRIV